MDKLIIQVRVYEGQMRSSNPNVPYSLEEIAKQPVECWRAGASVGLGDHPYPEFGHPTNAQLVERVVQMAGSAGREIAKSTEVRELFGLAT
jgi:uncharacterized protein (DUF849 family)